MKKITSFLMLFLMCFGMSGWAAPIDLPEVSTKDAPKWYVIDNYRGDALTAVDGKIQHLKVTSAASFWYVETSGDGYALVNANGNKVAHDYSLTADGATWYFLPNGANNLGLSISKTKPISGGSCMDANNWNTDIGTYQPSTDDWQGTTWTFESCEENVKSAIASMESKFVGSLKYDAEKLASWKTLVGNLTPESYLQFVQEKESLGSKQVEAGKQYIIQCAYPGYFQQQNVYKAIFLEGTQLKWGDLDKSNKQYLWNGETDAEGKIILQNAGNNQYLKNFKETVTDKAQAGKISLNELGYYQYNLNLGGNMHTEGHSGGSGKSGNIVAYSGAINTASAWYVYEADFDPSVEVSYNYNVEGKTVKTFKTTHIYGSEFSLPYVNDGFVASIATKGTVSSNNKTVIVNCVEHLPFVKTTDLKTPHWYLLTIHRSMGNFYLQPQADGTVMTIRKDQPFEVVTDASYQWCFMGNAVEGFALYNKANSGMSLRMNNPANIVEGDHFDWILEASTAYPGEAFCLRKKGVTSGDRFLNRQAGTNTLGYYSEADQGSSIEIHEPVDVVLSDFKTYESNAVGMPKDVSLYDKYVSTHSDLQNDRYNAEKLYAYVSARAALNEALANGEKIQFVPGAYYRLKNYCRDLSRDNNNRPGEGAFMGNTKHANASVSCHTLSKADAGMVWSLVAVEGGGYKLKNLNENKFISKTSDAGNSKYLTFVEDAEAGIYEIKDVSNAQYTFICTNKSGNNNGELHVSGNGVMNYNGGANSPSAWYIIPATDLEVNLATVGESSYSSLYLPFAVSMPSDVEAYTATLNEGQNALTMHKQTKVPANQGMVLKAAAGVNKATLNVLTTEPAAVDNVLTGTNVAKAVENAGNIWVLGNNEGHVGFYRPSATLTTLAANKAYVELAGAAAVNGFVLNFGETTGVESVEVGNPAAQQVIFDLSGRRVTKMTKGLYIVNGKKVLVK